MSFTIGILTGGHSRRMGRPKALIEFEGTTLLERTVRLARALSEDIALLGEPVFDLPPSLTALPILPDRRPDIGPIAGLEALLAARPGCSGILLACDMPHLCEPLLSKLADATGDFDAAVCRTRTPHHPAPPEQWHPCCGHYRPACLPLVQAAIDAGRFSIMNLFDRFSVRPIDLAGEEARWIDNWNTPQDLPGVTFTRPDEGRDG
ncbi:MAG: molybdenum cofactor guanylyltransferase [Phycisphaerae bacterium]